MQKRARKPGIVETRGWRVVDWNGLRNPPEIATSFVYFCVFLLALAALLLAVILFVRVFSAAQYGSPDDLNKLLLAFGALVGAPFLVWRVLIAAQQTAIARETMYTTLFTKAVEQLGATRAITAAEPGASEIVPNIEVRLGAIYALERIARDSKRDHWTIMETLCAYVRENSPATTHFDSNLLEVQRKKPWQRNAAEERLVDDERKAVTETPTVDIQAALTVIGRRSEDHLRLENALRAKTRSPGAYRLTLAGSDLRGADMRGLDFGHAIFDKCDLRGAKFDNALLEASSFYRTRLQKTDFRNADLSFACIIASILAEAKFFNANLGSALISGSILNNADLLSAKTDSLHACGIDFSAVGGLVQDQVDVAVLDSECIAPDGVDFGNAKDRTVIDVRDSWIQVRDAWEAIEPNAANIS